jgi:hypothetical protein
MMAARRFGALVLVPTVLQNIMIGENGKDSTTNVIFVNQGVIPARVSLAYINGTDLVDFTPADYLMINEVIEPNSRKELKGIAVEHNCMLAASVEPNNAVVNVVLYGFSEDI